MKNNEKGDHIITRLPCILVKIPGYGKKVAQNRTMILCIELVYVMKQNWKQG